MTTIRDSYIRRIRIVAARRRIILPPALYLKLAQSMLALWLDRGGDQKTEDYLFRRLPDYFDEARRDNARIEGFVVSYL